MDDSYYVCLFTVEHVYNFSIENGWYPVPRRQLSYFILQFPLDVILIFLKLKLM